MNNWRETGQHDGPWYTDAEARDPGKSLAHIAEYFPDILKGPNTIGLVFQHNQDLHLMPQSMLKPYERFIAIAGEHGLRYFLESPRPYWRLQYAVKYPRPTFTLTWAGDRGKSSPGVYGDIDDQVYFHYLSSSRTFSVQTREGGEWPFMERIDHFDLGNMLRRFFAERKERQLDLASRNGLFEFQRNELKQAAQSAIYIENAGIRDNLLILGVSGLQGVGKIAIPAAVTPTRFT